MTRLLSRLMAPLRAPLRGLAHRGGTTFMILAVALVAAGSAGWSNLSSGLTVAATSCGETAA